MRLIKAHAYGNDFLLADERELPAAAHRPAFARAVCDRRRGLGADGLIAFTPDGPGARMSLLNADGSYSEVSGNGVRCLAAWIGESRQLAAGADLEITTDAGVKRMVLLERQAARSTFRGEMGSPENVRLERLEVHGVSTEVVTLRVGNPQCVVLGPATPERLHSLAAALAVHPHFPAGTNVELAEVEDSARVRILIWERGVGPTEASGTGACAAAVAAIRFAGAARALDVASPGGTQRVEWLESGLVLTGTAELIADCRWMGEPGA